ncbi:MAG TPA: DUF378 domain-containing protein [Candidatus Eisenbacteria bacterium]|nr:DUF378 domain-containing protein [Candidatus Eisenbacteria bacterium]
MMKKMCGVHKAAWVLLLVGGVNWLLVGLLQKDLFVLLGLGMSSVVARAVYVLVGVSALSMLGLGKCCMKDGMCKCGDKDCSHCGDKGMDKSKMPDAPAQPKM